MPNSSCDMLKVYHDTCHAYDVLNEDNHEKYNEVTDLHKTIEQLSDELAKVNFLLTTKIGTLTAQLNALTVTVNDISQNQKNITPSTNDLTKKITGLAAKVSTLEAKISDSHSNDMKYEESFVCYFCGKNGTNSNLDLVKSGGENYYKCSCEYEEECYVRYYQLTTPMRHFRKRYENREDWKVKLGRPLHNKYSIKYDQSNTTQNAKNDSEYPGWWSEWS